MQNKKQIKELTRLCVKEIRDFVLGIIEGQFTTKESDLVIYVKTWEAMRENVRYATESGFYMALTGKHYWELEEEERKKVKSQYDRMNAIKQMLLLSVDSIKDIDMCEWQNYPRTESLRRMRVMASALEPYGFDWPNEKLESIATGTSELYDHSGGESEED